MNDSIFNSIINRFILEPIEEILIDGIQQMLIYYPDKVCCIASPFNDELEMIGFLQDFAISYNIRLDPLLPANGGMININNIYFRWHALLPCVSKSGPLFSLRRHNFDKFTLNDFLVTESQYLSFKNILKNNYPFLICGPTGSGKTTFLSILVKTFCANERILCLEHVSELPKLTPKWVGLVEKAPNLEGVGGFSLACVLKEALRLRPDRIIIGEIRADEAKIFLQSIDTGHNSILSTMHAGSASQAYRRLQMLSGYNDISMLIEDVNLHICILAKHKNHRIVKEILRFENNLWIRF